MPNGIPVIGLKYQFDWFIPYSLQSNVGVSLFPLGGMNPPNQTYSVLYERPPVNVLYDNLAQPPSTYGFILYFGISLALVGLIFCVCKLALFIQHQEGLKPTIPQIVLFLCCTADLILLTFLVFGPQYACQHYYWAPAVFFITHYLPYWYSAIVVYGFYMAEVSLITRAGLTGLDKFAIPCAIVCLALFVCEIVIGASFAAFDPEDAVTKFDALLELLAAIYLVVSSLLTIFVILVTLLLVKALASTSNTGLMIQFCLVNFGLIVLIWFAMLGNIFIAQGLLEKSPRWGEFGPQMAGSAGWWWGTALATLLLATSFRISVQKEIEVSKSATSSTGSSGGSSSGFSSSSSSSASKDPVIEL